MTLVSVSIGRIESYVTATATVQPQNRLEINPPVAGRIEKILVKEGEEVKSGDVLALMSSTDRAALLDAARLQGGDTLKRWEDVYNVTPLLAPIDGEVIVQKIKPGKNVTTSDAVLVLSNRLILQAQVDETDIGKVKLEQAVIIGLDAYPQIEVSGKVDHIYYESTVVSNVTTYYVDIVPNEVPDVFRSGMSASVKIIRESIDNALLLPRDVVKQDGDQNYVLVNQGGAPFRRDVQIGLSDDVYAQITNGISAQDRVIATADDFDSTAQTKETTNPFLPTPPKGGVPSGGRP